MEVDDDKECIETIIPTNPITSNINQNMRVPHHPNITLNNQRSRPPLNPQTNVDNHNPILSKRVIEKKNRIYNERQQNGHPAKQSFKITRSGLFFNDYLKQANLTSHIRPFIKYAEEHENEKNISHGWSVKTSTNYL